VASGGQTRWPVVLSFPDVSYEVLSCQVEQYQHWQAGALHIHLRFLMPVVRRSR
jgi:hypothetical protein